MNFKSRNTQEEVLIFKHKSLFIQRLTNLSSNRSKNNGIRNRNTVATSLNSQPSLRLIQKPALSLRPTTVDDSGDLTDEEMIDRLLEGIKDGFTMDVSYTEFMRNVKDFKMYIANNEIN
jgi:hypothetical protein